MNDKNRASAAMVALAWDGNDPRELMGFIATRFGVEAEKPKLLDGDDPIVEAIYRIDEHPEAGGPGWCRVMRAFALAILAEADRRAAARLEPAALSDAMAAMWHADGMEGLQFRLMAERIRAKEARP